MPQTKDRHDKFSNITVEVTKAFNEEIKQAANKNDISKSELIRRAISAYINN